jgi:hypothetical protein
MHHEAKKWRPLKVVQERLGHSTITLTADRYCISSRAATTAASLRRQKSCCWHNRLALTHIGRRAVKGAFCHGHGYVTRYGTLCLQDSSADIIK